jgi:hypothetical protein
MHARLMALALALSVLPISAAPAQERAEAFPGRPIKIVVPFPAGGPSDVLARMIGQRMSEDWGQPVVVENRAGANTVLGAQQVAKAPPDGYTLLMAIDSTLTMNQYLHRALPYDPFKTEARQHAGPEVLDQDIALLDEPFRQRDSITVFQIDADGPLIPVYRSKVFTLRLALIVAG